MLGPLERKVLGIQNFKLSNKRTNKNKRYRKIIDSLQVKSMPQYCRRKEILKLGQLSYAPTNPCKLDDVACGCSMTMKLVMEVKA